MRKVFWQNMVSLDGFIEGPKGPWDIDWHVVDDDFGDYATKMLSTIDAIILGRVTYEGFAAYWPSSTDAEAAAMNELPKIVFSRTLEKVEWQNSRLVKDNIAAEVSRLKQQPGKDIAMFGSADLASTFMRLDLIDEYRIMVNPVVLGGGAPLFKDVKERMHLRLLQTETLSSGVVVLYYEPESRQ